MKTFQSSELRYRPKEVFESAVEDGRIRLNHGSYKDMIFELIARPRGKEGCSNCAGGYMQDGGHEPGCPKKEGE